MDKRQNLLNYAKDIKANFPKRIVFDEDGRRISEQIIPYNDLPTIVIAPNNNYQLTEEEKKNGIIRLHECIPDDIKPNINPNAKD